MIVSSTSGFYDPYTFGVHCLVEAGNQPSCFGELIRFGMNKKRVKE